jgi:hypothetical protein
MRIRVSGILSKWVLATARLILGVGVLRAEEVWTLHGFDYGLIRTKRFEVDLHTRFRTNEHMTNLEQGRSGVVLRGNASQRFTAIGGYYFGQQEDGRDEWTRFHRIFGGGEALVYRRERIRLTSRTLVERFMAAPDIEFNRYRQRFRLSASGKVSPYVSSEWFFDAKGYLSARHGGGIRWKWSSWSWAEAGYLYDDRSSALGPKRHMIVTQMFFARPKD